MRRAQEGVRRQVTLAALLAAVVILTLTLVSCDNNRGGSNVEGPPRSTIPVVLEVSQPGTATVADSRAVLDYSNAKDGYVCVMSNLPDITVKVLVNIMDTEYQYTIDAPGTYITIPLSEGDGSYSVGVWQNVSGNYYAAVFSQTIDVVLDDEFRPFLYSNQYVNFALDDEATAMSQQVVEGSVTDVDALNNIYLWVCENFDYDREKAASVAPGYLPDNTSTINEKKGICFDYAVLTASMLRAQRIPAKLVIGYADTAYHAWMEVYCVETGTVIRYAFNGDEWVRMDPTFDAANDGRNDLLSVIGNGTNYHPMLYY